MRGARIIDDAPQHLAPAIERDPITANCIIFADWQTKRRSHRSLKKISEKFLALVAQMKTPLGWSGVHLL